MITLEKGFTKFRIRHPYKPKPKPEHLHKPKGKDWGKIRETVVSLIDSTPEDQPVRMSAILKCLEDRFELDVTPAVVRNCLLASYDWWRYLRTLIPPTGIEQIEQTAVGLAQNSVVALPDIEDIVIVKYRGIYGKRARRGKFDESVGYLVLSALRDAGFKI